MIEVPPLLEWKVLDKALSILSSKANFAEIYLELRLTLVLKSEDQQLKGPSYG